MKTNYIKIIKWDDTLSVGFKSMDSQHQTLIRMINDMCTGYRYCEPLADAHFIAYSYKIFEFIRSHFAAEEKILAAIQYPYLEKHRRRHQNLLKILLSQMRKFDLGLPCAPCEFICFLQNDLLTHMAIFDKKYAAFKPRLQAL